MEDSRPLLGSEEDEATESINLKSPTPLPWLRLSPVFLVDISVALSVNFMAPFITEVCLFQQSGQIPGLGWR